MGCPSLRPFLATVVDRDLLAGFATAAAAALHLLHNLLIATESPLRNSQFATENGTFIDDLPIQNHDFNHSYIR